MAPMSGLFGAGGVQTLAVFDFSVLGDYYQAQIQLRAQVGAQTSSRAQAARDVVSFAPWDQNAEDAGSISRLRDALGVASFVDVRESSFDRADVDPEHKKLFALYMGLSRLQALAARASADATPVAELTGLNRRFQLGLGEIKTYLTNTSFNDLTLLFGKRESHAASGLKIARPPSKYVGPSIVSGAATNIIPGLGGSEVFTVSAEKSGGTTDVVMDLSEIAGGLSLNNVIAYMNGKMEAAGLTTRFTTTIFDGKTASDPKRYGIGVQTVATERISLSAATTSPAVYVAGVAGSNGSQTGQLIKLTDDGAGVSANFTAKIAGEAGTTDVQATATDADGNVFVVGTVTGDLGSGIVQGQQDVYLRKYDAAGQLIWSRLLGSSERASGFAIATDADGNVAIAGKATDYLTSTSVGGGDDTFVTKFDANGQEVFTRQIAPVTDDQANALAFGADGSLYVAGQTTSAMSASLTHGGGSDAYLMKLTTSGSLDYVRQFGGAGDDRATALAIDGNGDVVLGTVEAGEAKVRKLLSADGTSAAVWEVTLGALGEGQLSSLAVDGGAVFVAGSTTNAALDAGGQASIVTAHSGGTDGFVMKIADAGLTASADFLTYVGTSGSDSATGIAVSGGALYVSGSTNGALGGGAAPSYANGYVTKFDATGARVWTHQYESTQGAASARAIAVDAQGGSVLDKLGLPRGAIAFDETRLITAASSVRAGDYFYVKVNGGASFKVSVSATDTMQSLTNRINSVLLLKGEAVLTRSGGDGIRINAKEGNVVELIRGADGFDALAGLGLTPGKLDNTKDTVQQGAAKKDINVFSLDLEATAAILDKTLAKTLTFQLASAMSAIQSAYRAINPAAQAGNQSSAQAAAAYQSLLAALGG
jgi:hypothetical protein